MHILCQLSLKRTHHSKFLTYEDFGKQLLRSGEHHSLLSKILNKSALGKEFWHIAYLMFRLTGKHLACTRKDSSPYKDWHIRKI